MKFGEKVRKARLAAHFSQQQLADRTGISLRTIQNYERIISADFHSAGPMCLF